MYENNECFVGVDLGFIENFCFFFFYGCFGYMDIIDFEIDVVLFIFGIFFEKILNWRVFF